jgi:hypothetical protein
MFYQSVTEQCWMSEITALVDCAFINERSQNRVSAVGTVTFSKAQTVNLLTWRVWTSAYCTLSTPEYSGCHMFIHNALNIKSVHGQTRHLKVTHWYWKGCGLTSVNRKRNVLRIAYLKSRKVNLSRGTSCVKYFPESCPCKWRHAVNNCSITYLYTPFSCNTLSDGWSDCKASL